MIGSGARFAAGLQNVERDKELRGRRMSKTRSIGISALSFPLVAALLLAGAAWGAKDPPSTVESVDLNRYVGLWYEVAKIPNRFQSMCARRTTARYLIRDDGKIAVINSCVKGNGDIEKADGLAKVADGGANAKLKVSFVRFLGMSLFWGDYWIIGLGDEYEYAVIGNPDRKYGWILSRTPTLDKEKLDEAFAILRDQGYAPEAFEMTPQ